MGDQADHYPITLPDGTEAKYPRVTAILGRLVRKPELERWQYWRTIDSISGLVAEGGKSLDDVELRGILSDSLTINEWLTLNRMRPDDYAQEASGRGESAHNALANLAAEQEAGIDLDKSLALTVYQNMSGYEKGVADWWLEKEPEVLYSEHLLYSQSHEYAGTCDLITWHPDTNGGGIIKITDLKTRKLPLRPYKTDLLQVTMYAAAWMDMPVPPPIWNKPLTSVLLVGPDGSFEEFDFDANVDVVPSMMELDRELRREV